MTEMPGPAPSGRWFRWLLVFLALAVTVPAAQAATPTTSTSTGSSALYGMIDGRLLDGTAAQDAADLANDASTGITAVRAQLSWNAVEPAPGLYRWGAFDTLVNAVAARHMSLLALIDFTPAWARAAGCKTWTCPPADSTQFAAFAAAAAARYGSKVAAWEIWNEPNNPQFWSPTPDPAAYSQLLQVTASAIRAADPGAYIVSGGLAPGSQTSQLDAPAFLQAVCAAGGLASVDAVGDHPYSFPVPPDYAAAWNGWQQMNNTPTSIRSVMTACGMAAKPIWITEYGAPTNGPGVAAMPGNYELAAHPNHVTPQLQAEMVTDAVADVKSYSWVGALFFYDSEDSGVAPTTNQNFFGLQTYAGAAKPAWTALHGALTGS